MLIAKKKGKGETVGRPIFEGYRGAYGAVHSNSGCAVYGPRRLPLCDATGTPIYDIFIENPVRQTRSYARLKSRKKQRCVGIWLTDIIQQ